MKLRRNFHRFFLAIFVVVFTCSGWLALTSFKPFSTIRDFKRSSLLQNYVSHEKSEKMKTRTPEADLNESETLHDSKTTSTAGLQQPPHSHTNQQVAAISNSILKELKNLSLDNVSLPTTDVIQRRRQLILEEACTKLGQNRNLPSVTWSTTVHFIISDNHRFLFCFAPKVACTTWKGIMRKLYQNETSGKTHNRRFVKMNDILKSPDAVRNRWLKYNKVVFAREPLNRALSAYLDKFVYGPEKLSWERKFGMIIVKRYRQYSSQQLKQRPYNITFTEFIRYLTDTGPSVTMNQMMDHWLPISSFTHPCQIKYDFIGKYETLAQDGPYVMKKFGLDDVVLFPEVHRSQARDSMKIAYAEVPEELIRKLQSYYSMDYEIFGYSKRDVLETILPSNSKMP